MSVLLLSLFLLLSFSEVISQSCPPSSGIYLRRNGTCYTNNGSYFTDGSIRPTPELECVLPNATLNGGQWIGPNGVVPCDSGNNQNVQCTTGTGASLSVFINPPSFLGADGDGQYMCCLPTSCSTPGTNIITTTIFRYAEIESFTVADLPSNMTVYPQEYKLNCTKIGHNTYGISMSFGATALVNYTNCHDPSNNCPGTVLSGPVANTIRYTVNITWDGMTVSSGSISQSTTGDQMYQCRVADHPAANEIRIRNVTIKVPATAPSSLTEVSKTVTTIIVSWTALDSSDADGYVVNVTNDTDTVQTVQVEGSSNNATTLNGLNIGTNYSITVRAYQQLLGPASSTISVQTLSTVINSINWTLVSSIKQLNNTQYRIDCLTTIDVNPSTDVYWLVNGVMRSNSNYSSIDVLTYNNTLLVYPDPLGVSVNVTCIAMIGGVNYSQSVILDAPSRPPNNVRGFILNATSIKLNWTSSLEINGYVIEYNTGGVTRNVVSTSEDEIVLTNLSLMSTYTMSVYSYIDLPSLNSTVTVLRFDVPSPVTSLSVSNVSTTDITVNWTIPSSDNYVTYYTISYTPSCPELSSGNETVSVGPHQSTTTYSYTLIGLYSGMNYTITVRAGNVLGGSDSVLTNEITSSVGPTGSADFLFLLQPMNNLTWNEVNCSQRNGLITGYTVMISNSSITYNLTSTERYIILNNLVFGIEYNISVAAVNSVGRGPFSDPIEVVIGIVPGPVGSVSSIMETTWAVISWSVPSYIPSDYPIITYEIGYHILESGNCSMVDDDDINIQMLQFTNSTNSNTFINITSLNDMSCYIFGVRAYTDNGYGEWTVIANETLELPPLPSPSLTSTTQYFTASSVISSSIPTTRDTSTTSSLVQPSTTASTSPPASAGDTGLSPVVLGGAGGGAVVGILILAVLILIVVLVLRRKKRSKDKLYISGGTNVKKDIINDIPLLEQKPSIGSESEYEAMTTSPKVEVTETTDLYTTVDTAKQDPLYANVEQKGTNGVTGAAPAFDPLIPNTCPVSVSDLGTHVASHHSDNNTAFNQQYQELYTGEDLPSTVGFSEQNKPFNRFKNIAPYDEHMIVLQKKPNMDLCEREYINATYIDGYSSANKFIAAQGPMKKTLVDFWRLIWQEKPVSIVMVTNLKEGTKSKCEQYWPNGRAESEEFGPFTVTLVDEQVLPDFVIRSITVMIQNGSNDSHTLTQYHLTSWPDHGVPEYGTPLMILHRQSNKSWSPSKGPILVHCSAGVGRTGTFIAIDIALEQAKREGVVDIAGIVNRLRQQRMKMVQTLDQYVFLHDTVLEAIICGETEIPTENYMSTVQKLKAINPKTRSTGMAAQFGLLHQVTPDPNDVHCNSAKAHASKNRSNEYLPPDKFIVALKEANGYINASYLNGYREKRAFIIAQSPMENTARDFWKMIVDYKVSAIVMLCGEEDCCYPYWTGPKTHDEFVVEIANEIKSNGYIERMFKVSFDKESRSVLQLQVTDWPQDGVVREPRTVLQVIDDVIHRQQKIGGGPVVVHCSDTVSRSGVYCSVSIALEQCKAEGVVDVFQVTKAVRRSKPGAVTTLEQYTSIYDVIDMYLQMNSMYGNFSINKQ